MVGGLNLRRFIGEYDAKGEQIFTEGRLYFEIILQYKGYQTPAIILADVEPNDKDSYQHLLFTGMTRATVQLKVVMDMGNSQDDLYQKQAS